MLVLIIALLLASSAVAAPSSSVTATVSISEPVTYSPSSISAKVLPHSYFNKTLSFTSPSELYLSLSSPGFESAEFIPNQVALAPFVTNNSVVKFFVASSTQNYIEAGIFQIPVNLIVSKKYKLVSGLDSIPKFAFPGDNISVYSKVRLDRPKNVFGAIPVNLTYSLRHHDEILETKKNVLVLEHKVYGSESFVIPDGAKGSHKIKFEATHLNKRTSKTRYVFVLNKKYAKWFRR